MNQRFSHLYMAEVRTRARPVPWLNVCLSVNWKCDCSRYYRKQTTKLPIEPRWSDLCDKDASQPTYHLGLELGPTVPERE